MIENLIIELIAALNANTAALKGAASNTPAAAPAEQKKPRKAKETEAAPAEASKPAEPPTPAPEPAKAVTPLEVVNPTIEDLRAVGGKLVAAGRGEELKAVLAEYNATKLSAVPADKFPEVHANLTAKLNAK